MPTELRTADVARLAAALRREVRGDVRFDKGTRAIYATDASNYRQVPIGVVCPRSTDDIVAAVGLCREYNVPVLPRGGGTSLAGQCCNVAVVLDCSRHLTRVLSIDTNKRLARVEPGCILDTLRHQTQGHELTFGPDPATHSHNTLGGMIGNDSCGIRSVMAVNAGTGARTADNLDSMEVLTYQGLRLTVGPTSDDELARIIAAGGPRGEIYGQLKALRDRYADQIRARFPDIPRCVSGFNLPELLPERGFNVARALVGSEGTCVTVLEATVMLIPSPPFRSLLVLGYEDVYHAADHVTDILPYQPTGLEGLDELLIDFMKKKGIHPQNISLLPEGKGWLLAEFGGWSKAESDAAARKAMDAVARSPHPPSMKLFDDSMEEELVWNVREAGLGATANVPGEPSTWPGWEDSAVPPARAGEYLRALDKLFRKYGYQASLYGHFGQGCIHCRVPFDMQTAEGIAAYHRFAEEAADLVVSFGGSLSGEHGDGQSRAELLPRMFGDELVGAFREFKAIWDPRAKMNPGKVVDPYGITENLRLGAAYHPPELATRFRFPDDDGRFSKATLRCVGIGNCRQHHGGVMCPSYMATNDEEHSTRGRARILFEMLQGEVITDGWKSKEVFGALDLCLSCKGCKGECPVNVDMAMYKSEFLSHYYRGRLRPRHAFAFGHIDRWARVASVAPRLVNAVSHSAWLGPAVRWIAGMDQRRTVPTFAPETFTHWFGRRKGGRASGSRVVLWPDTFNNHFHPDTARSAVAVLEHAGCTVVVPSRAVCCGRPLYDYGYLDLARRYLRRTLDVLAGPIAEGLPVMVLEPSCASVFRDELVNLLPDDPRAERLCKQTFLLSEWLEEHADRVQWPHVTQQALVHAHCHHKSVMKIRDEEKVLHRMGIDYTIPAGGCCGMAGAFGFERGVHHDVAMRCGEHQLLPAVRDAGEDTLLIADGFSCREQIAQGTGRTAVHLADVIAAGLARSAETTTPAPRRSGARQEVV